MNMSIIAMLLSFAMMLTGAGGAGQPAQARTLYLHNVSVTYNDQTVNLTPALKLGASTDGEKAVFDLGVELGDETLFPTQIGVSEDGVTALFTGSDIAATVTAKALDSLSEQANAALANVTVQDDETAELMRFLTEEFLPAYTGLLEAVTDEAYGKQLEEKVNAVFDGLIDRGEGTPVTATAFGEEYALTEYHYTIDADQMAALIDAIYASDEKLNDYYQALFKLYDMMPEESGLNGMHSFADLFTKTGMDMAMDVVEQRSDDGEVDIMTATLTFDMSGMIQAQMANSDGQAVEMPEIPPIVMNIQSTQVGERKDATVDCDFTIEDVGMAMTVNASGEGLGNVDMDMNMKITQDGKDMGVFIMNLNARTDAETGEGSYTIGYHFDAADAVALTFDINGACAADGTSQNSVSLSVNANGESFALSFDLDVLTDAIDDKANGHEAAVVIDDLSEEALSALGEDQTAQAAMMQVVGSMSMDAQKLMADESVAQLAALFLPTEQEEEVEYPDEGIVEDAEYEIEAEPAEYDYDAAAEPAEHPVAVTGVDEDYELQVVDEYEYVEPEDDGELPFEVPQLTWLPEGWQVESVDVDTAYDTVNMYISGPSESQFGYFICYSDIDENTVTYQVAEDGGIEPVDGREISLSDYGNGSVSVSMREGGVWINLSLDSEQMDVETIGKIVAGIQF